MRRNPVRARLLTATLAMVVAIVVAACTGGDSPDGSGGGRGAIGPVTTVPVRPGLLREIRERGRVRIGVKEDVPLFGLVNPVSGARTGFDIEMAKLLAVALFPPVPGGRPAASRIDFTEALSKNRERFLQEGVVDLVISTYTITDARRQLVDFAGPYYIAGQDILAPIEEVRSGRITGAGDLAGKKVCTVEGSTSLATLRAVAPAADTSVLFDKYSDCFKALQDGRVQAMTTDDVILLGLADTDPGRFAVTGNPFRTEPYGIGLPKGNEELRQFIDDTLQQAFADGAWARAFEATIGRTGVPTPNPPALARR